MAVSQDDLDLMHLCVWREARGESFWGKVLVASVVLERVRDPRWPKTIRNVILQPWQFSGFNKVDPNFYEYPADDDPALEECKLATKMALEAGEWGGIANHYLNPQYASPSWYDPEKVTAVVGKHHFLRL